MRMKDELKVEGWKWKVEGQMMDRRRHGKRSCGITYKNQRNY